jgi:O-succinylbenzoate synthase
MSFLTVSASNTVADVVPSSITSIDAFRYRLPLTAPLDLGVTTITHRTGLLVRCEDASGRAGWGDVAPLPGFSDETLGDAEAALRALRPQLLQEPADPFRLERKKESSDGWTRAPASVRCGLELALFHLQAQAGGTSLPAVMHDAPRPTVSLNALVTETGDKGMDTARQAAAEGYRAVKAKVGRQPVADDIAFVRRLRDALPADVALRLDANRAWSVEAAETFGEAIGGLDIAYVEEPLADASWLPDWAPTWDLPVALDETMRTLGPGDLPRHRYAKAAVLKPTLTGGLVHTLRTARAATREGLTPVLSAAYESGVGLRGLVACAAGLGPRDVPVGLGTYDRLAADVLAPPLTLGPSVDVASLVDPDRTVEARHLARLSLEADASSGDRS